MSKCPSAGILSVIFLLLQTASTGFLFGADMSTPQKLLEVLPVIHNLYPEEISEEDVANVKKLFEKYTNPSLDSWIPEKKILAYPALGTLGAVMYGILHDQVTARLCIEYFNSDVAPHHKELLDDINFPWKDSPTAIALLWGTVATWWFGLTAGTAVGCAARLGPMPKLSFKDLAKPTGIYAAFVAGSSLLSGLVGYFFARKDTKDDLYDKTVIRVPPGMAFTIPNNIDQYVPAEKESAFFSNCFSHAAAYISGVLGAVGLSGWIIYKRIKLFKEGNQDALKSLEKIINKLKELKDYQDSQ